LVFSPQIGLEVEMMEEKSERRHFTAEQKVKIIKEALKSDLGVSGVCKKYGVSSAQFYQWQERFFEGAREGLERSRSGASSKELRKIEELSRENDRMKNVISVITAENIDFKKKLGES
jgi:putative transposase